MVKISLECALNWWQGMLVRKQRFQHADVSACHLDVLLPSHDVLFREADCTIMLCHI